ncbi:MAG: hypothetical protein ACI8PW_001132 [Methylophilaceae bacterium]
MKSLPFEVTDKDKESINKVVTEKLTSFINLIRGHFIFSAILKFTSAKIKELKSKVTISNESFFGGLLLAFEKNFTLDHPHYTYYENQVNNISIKEK